MRTARSVLDAPTWDLLDSVVVGAECVAAMACIPDESVDAICTDPPYGLHFMGKTWDRFGGPTGKDNTTHSARGGAMQAGKYDLSLSANQSFQLEMTRWATECLRILKPGGHLLSFGGTRTYHRLACAIEDAGFEIRDSILYWGFGSGFPKSLNVAVAIDKAKGAPNRGRAIPTASTHLPNGRYAEEKLTPNPVDAYEPASPEAAEWEGWGTALKPSYEPIVVARKPFPGTVAQNVLEHGTGAINVDGCRVGTDAGWSYPNGRGGEGWHGRESLGKNLDEPMQAQAGRWPANVVLSHTPLCEPVGTRIVKGDPRDTGNGERPSGFADVGAESGDGEPNAPVYGDEEVVEWDCAPGCPVSMLDAQSGDRKAGGNLNGSEPSRPALNTYGERKERGAWQSYGDSGGASRFFYCAKTSRAERNAGLENLELRTTDDGRQTPIDNPYLRGETERRNSHPTVKPIDLMRWLVRMVTPPDGLVLDPFAGSGTTGCAATLEGFDFVGIEREAEYVEIAEARIAFWAQHEGREVDEVLAVSNRSAREAARHEERGQMGLQI